jgi:2-iminobutanoate/2-iminopropanoate deaminase
MPTHCGDETCPSCVVAGDYVFMAHHAGGFDKADVAHQVRASFESMKRTLQSVGGTLDDMVQINLYLKNIEDFRAARDVFYEYFSDGFPARMSSTTQFLDSACLCMLDGIAYKKRS